MPAEVGAAVNEPQHGTGPQIHAPVPDCGETKAEGSHECLLLSIGVGQMEKAEQHTAKMSEPENRREGASSCFPLLKWVQELLAHSSHQVTQTVWFCLSSFAQLTEH